MPLSRPDRQQGRKGQQLFDKSSFRLLQLDGIRGMAILLVLLWHYSASQIGPQDNGLASFVAGLYGLTWSGVDLFFVLSGFLLGGILLDNRRDSHYFKIFCIRRICRTFPLYFAWLLLFIVITAREPALTTSGPLAPLFQGAMLLWSYATLTQNVAMAFVGTTGASWLGITLYLTPLSRPFVPENKVEQVSH